MMIATGAHRIWARTNWAKKCPFMGQEVHMHSRFTDSLAAGSLLVVAGLHAAEPPRTEITRWQDGKEACISLSFDDSSINQFRVDIPLLNERRIPGTFFVI